MKRRSWTIFLAFLLTAVFLGLALRNLSWAEMREAFAAADMRWLPLIYMVTFVDLAVRAMRWRLLLSPVADAPAGVLYRLEAIGLAANNIIVARLGELGRAALAGRKLKIPFLAALSSIVVERLCDTVAVLILFNAAAFYNAGIISPKLRLITLGVLLCALSVLAVLVFAHRALEPGGALESGLKRVPKARDLSLKLVTGARALRTWLAFPILGLSLLLWCVDSVTFWIVDKSMGLGLLDFGRAVLVLGWGAAGASIPAAPGAVGTFEAVVRDGMQTMGATAPQALVYALIAHIMGYFTVTVLGLIFMSMEGLSLAKFEEGAEKVSLEAKR
ncbi:MAG: flippase-like domain-containing protein [Elusimicrobia bacterium]|nr:flippase-like domain-containing protein [Elusimicrobiota bacterium]